MTPALHAAHAMHQAQTTFWDLLARFEHRAHGLRESQPKEVFSWYITKSSNESPTHAGRVATLYHLSGHQKIAHAQLVKRAAALLIPAREAITACGPVLHDASVSLLIPMNHQGTIEAPYWKIQGYSLRGMLAKRLDKSPIVSLLEDLGAAAPPTGTFTIGNKTLRANGPAQAMAQHLRLTAPKQSTRTRTPPPVLPQIHQVWNSAEAMEMAQQVVRGWRASS